MSGSMTSCRRPFFPIYLYNDSRGNTPIPKFVVKLLLGATIKFNKKYHRNVLKDGRWVETSANRTFLRAEVSTRSDIRCADSSAQEHVRWAEPSTSIYLCWPDISTHKYKASRSFGLKTCAGAEPTPVKCEVIC